MGMPVKIFHTSVQDAGKEIEYMKQYPSGHTVSLVMRTDASRYVFSLPLPLAALACRRDLVRSGPLHLYASTSSNRLRGTQPSTYHFVERHRFPVDNCG